MVIYGINPVLEALHAGRVRRIRVGARADKRIEVALAIARSRGIAIERAETQALDRAARGGAHQGIVADLEAAAKYSIKDLVGGAAQDPPLIVVLDGVEDPHNLGAIIRTVDAAGAHGIVRQERRAAALDGIAAKASAGAIAHVRIATVVNIARAIEELKEAGLWTVGFAGDAADSYEAVDFTLPTALVAGGEGEGLRRLTRERCDRLVAIPMHGAVSSLNVSVAVGVALFEAARQRRAGSSKI